MTPDPVSVVENVETLTSAETDAIEGYDSDTGDLIFAAGAPASVGDIGPGDILPIAPREGLASGALTQVTGASTAQGVTTVTTEPVDLPAVVENVPDAASDIAMAPIGDPVVTDLADGVTLDPEPTTTR